MPRPSTFNTDVASRIIGARLVGAPLRRCVAAAGVSWSTFTTWLDRGRKVNEARERGDATGNALDAALAQFAADIDAADARCESTLYARAMKGTEEDPRLAFDMLRWRAEKPSRDAKLGLLKAQREVEEKRATGELVERHEHSVKDPLDELRSRLDRLALTGEAGGDPRGDQRN